MADTTSTNSHTTARRTVLAAAWAVPVVVTAAAAPAFAASGDKVVLTITQPYYSDTQQRFVYTIKVNDQPLQTTVNLHFYNTVTKASLDVPRSTDATGTGSWIIDNGTYINVYLKNYNYVVVQYNGQSSKALELSAT